MEQNNFEELEAVELEESKVEKTPELKEYEKLLIKEANREAYERAVELVSFGCFNQKEEASIDFTKLEQISTAKKFKGIYKLYRNLETKALIFICPLVENNKGDKDENKMMKPYAFDCIYTEAMDDETFKLVKKSAKNNINNKLKALYIASYSAFFALATLFVIVLIATAIAPNEGGLAGFFSSLFITGGMELLVGLCVMLPLLVLISIKYKSYKDK